VYFDMMNYVKALEDFNRAIVLHEDYPDCYYYRGLTHNKLKGYDEAIEDFLKALELNSRFKGSIYNGLGYSYNEKRDFTKALHVESTDQVPQRGSQHRAGQS
jgi:tetratricopeptide (TPR) repeat protein